MQTYARKGKGLKVTPYDGPFSASSLAEGSKANARPADTGGFTFEGLGVEPEGDAFILTGKVHGPDLAYLYTDILLRDTMRERFYGPVFREYVRAKRNEGSSGITRPVWDDPTEIRVKMRPLLRLITDGADHAFCFASPEGYSSPGYRQGGLYTVSGETEPLRALLGFSGDGTLKRVIAYPEQDRRGGARVLTPAQDDRFVPFVQVFTPDGKGGWTIATAVADTLTMGSWPFRVVTEKPFAGDYLAGVIAQAQDGGMSRAYVPFHVDL